MKKIRYQHKARKRSLRHTHATAAALEDALAVVLDVLFELERARVYSESRLGDLSDILRITRAGPHSYDQERAAGLRITIRRR